MKEEKIAAGFAFILMSVASIVALFMMSWEEPIESKPIMQTPSKTVGRKMPRYVAPDPSPVDTFEDIDPRVVERQMQDFIDQEKMRRNPIRYTIEKMWSY